MRTPHNDEPLTPTRSCILSREPGSRGELIRLALSPDGAVWPDVRAKAPGRGAWIGVTRDALAEAQAKGKLKGALARAFKGAPLTIPADLPAQVEAALLQSAMDRLGLESRAGHLLTGTDRIETAARSGQLRLLLHAADAGEDGKRKLAQAWRVGSDAEGSDLKGLALPLSRPILSAALGRENVVHLGLTDASAAKRVEASLGRWLRFIGSDPAPQPCADPSVGASASTILSGATVASPEGI